MNIQIFGKAKSFDTKKAERYFKERRVKFQAIDLAKTGISKGELTSVLRCVKLEDLLDPGHRDAALLAYVNSYVHNGSNIWPMYNTATLMFNQDWFKVTENAQANGTTNPMEIWTTRK